MSQQEVLLMKKALLWIGATVMGLELAGAEETGPVTIGGVTYDYVDPGEPFKEVTRPEPDWPLPEPTPAEQSAGIMADVTSDPGDYKPDRWPKPEEHVTKLSAFLTPGEDEPVWVGVYGLAELLGLTIRVHTGNAPVTVDVRHLHFWPQRTGWRSREWYMTPELILPCQEGKKWVPAKRGVLEEQPFNLKQGETAAFWLTLTAAADAPPGLYEGSVAIRGHERPALELPLQIEVLPFTLRKPPDRYWLLYCDSGRWTAMSDEQVLAELRDFARHGMTGLVEMPLGSVDLSELKAGPVRFDAGAFKKLAAQGQEAGLPGPHVCSYGGMPERVREALGVECDLPRETWPEELKAGVAAVARAAVEATADAPARWYFYGVDEPSGDNTYAIQDYQCWRQGGAETYATFGDPRFLEKAAAYLTAPCFVSYLISTENGARTARESCAQTGAEFWWYGTGSYVNPFPQEGFMFHNRYGAGYLFWKSGAKAEVSWTFCRPHEDVFNDFDGSRANSAEPKEQATSYPHLLRPDDWSTYQGAIPTIAWESLREGVDDYRYLHTLSALIDEAGRSGEKAAREAAQEAEETLAALIEAIPWANPMGGVAFETRRMQQVRRAVADLIVDLQALLAGHPGHAPETRRVGTRRTAAHITLVVRTEEPDPAAATSLPVIPVMPAGTPPEIDGLLEDPCWLDSAVAGDFRAAQTGQPAATPTEARILYDDRALYVAFHCPEPAMDHLVAKQQGHDTPLVWVDDGIEFFLASRDRGRYAHVIVNTNQSVYDEIGQDPAWDPAIEVGLHKGDDFWNVELALPWAELEQVGIERSTALAVNFCRNRFATPEEHPHTAWSCPFGGFHVPQRFGVALLQKGPVALADLKIPGFWGQQTLGVGLRNLTPAPLTAQVGIQGLEKQTVHLPAESTAPVQIPVKLLKPGPTQATLVWEVAGHPPQEVPLALQVPEPITVADGDRFVSSGDTLEMPIRVNVAPGDRQPYRIRLVFAPDSKPQRVELAARPGRQKRVRLALRRRTRWQMWLVNRTGGVVGEAIEGSFFPLSP